MHRLTHSCLKQPKPPDNYCEISLTSAIFRKYSNGNCLSEMYLNSPSNTSQMNASFRIYFQKYDRSRQHFVKISEHEWVKGSTHT